MSPAERSELHEAMRSIDARFSAVEADVATIKTDLAFIKGATRFVVVMLGIAVPAVVGVLGWLMK